VRTSTNHIDASKANTTPAYDIFNLHWFREPVLCASGLMAALIGYVWMARGTGCAVTMAWPSASTAPVAQCCRAATSVVGYDVTGARHFFFCWTKLTLHSTGQLYVKEHKALAKKYAAA